jgi:phenylacetate-CoA ligase
MAPNDPALQAHFDKVRVSPLYRAHYDGIADYRDAPVLDKATLIGLLKSGFRLGDETRGVYLVRSGGSTRAPLIFPVDIAENLEQRRRLADALVTSGVIRPTTVALNMFSYGQLYRTAAILDDILERCRATTLPLSAETKDKDLHDAARHFRPNLLMGSPSRLALFAHYLGIQGTRLEVPDLLYGGEFLRPSVAATFRERFGTRNIYALYGSAETGTWGWSRYSDAPGVYRFIDGIHVEIAEPDAEGFGRIIATNLLRERFPIFRYDMGDIGRLGQSDGHPHLELRARAPLSFVIDSTKLSIDDFRHVTQDAAAFQIQLSQNDRSQQVLRLLLVQDVPEADRPAFRERMTIEVCSLIHCSREAVDVSVDLATPQQLHANPVTAKTPLVVDFRG